MSKILHLEITRSEGADVYIEVPDDFESRPYGRNVSRQLGAEAAKKTLSDYEWDKANWSFTIEVQSCEILSASEGEKIMKEFRYLKLADAQDVLAKLEADRLKQPQQPPARSVQEKQPPIVQK
jgi:hypothetical protein